jgi:hypothetical protein
MPSVTCSGLRMDFQSGSMKARRSDLLMAMRSAIPKEMYSGSLTAIQSETCSDLLTALMSEKHSGSLKAKRLATPKETHWESLLVTSTVMPKAMQMAMTSETY